LSIWDAAKDEQCGVEFRSHIDKRLKPPARLAVFVRVSCGSRNDRIDDDQRRAASGFNGCLKRLDVLNILELARAA
jgi:hypothetical protein